MRPICYEFRSWKRPFLKDANEQESGAECEYSTADSRAGDDEWPGPVLLDEDHEDPEADEPEEAGWEDGFDHNIGFDDDVGYAHSRRREIG